MRERDIEQRLRAELGKKGAWAIKLTAPGNDGLPDRIVILPGGRIIFVELKADRGELTKLQIWQQQRLRSLGCEVRTLRGMTEALQFVEEVCGP